MITYLIARLLAWLWCFDWPPSEESRDVLCALSTTETIMEIVAIV